ncbi:hypothetical protein OROGR_030151 [Orobanche gracilis]
MSLKSLQHQNQPRTCLSHQQKPNTSSRGRASKAKKVE